jgi:hypothetical protein
VLKSLGKAFVFVTIIFMGIPASFPFRQVSEIPERISKLVSHSIRVARVFSRKVPAIAKEHLPRPRVGYKNRMP